MKKKVKCGIRGQFKIHVQRANGKEELIVANNSLTIRGAIEFASRMCFVNNVSYNDGGPVEDFINIFGLSFRTIDEDDFVALDREDRVAYYNAANVLILGDNRDWHYEDNDEPNWGDFRTDDPVVDTWDQYPYPRMNQVPTLPYTNYDPDLDITTVRFKSAPLRQGEAGVWKGIALAYQRTSHAINAVIATAVLPDPLEVRANDYTTMYYTLSLSPTIL